MVEDLSDSAAPQDDPQSESGDSVPSPAANPDGSAEYGESQIKYLSDLEHVRHAAGMYIGDKSGRGMHWLTTGFQARSPI